MNIFRMSGCWNFYCLKNWNSTKKSQLRNMGSLQNEVKQKKLKFISKKNNKSNRHDFHSFRLFSLLFYSYIFKYRKKIKISRFQLLLLLCLKTLQLVFFWNKTKMVYNKFYYVFVYSLDYFFLLYNWKLWISLSHPHSLTEKLNEKLGMNVAVAMV